MKSDRISSLPQSTEEIFFIISMDWWQNWIQYTYYDAVKLESDLPESENPQGDNLADCLENLHLHKESLEEHQKYAPGPINSKEQIQKLLVEERFLAHPFDPVNNIHLKTSMKEDEDFVLVPQNIWEYLHQIYSGRPIPRFTIKIDHIEEMEEGQKIKEELTVEIFWKKIYVYILPKKSQFISFKKPSAVYLSRKANVFELKKKIAEIINSYDKNFSIKEIMQHTRIWKLECGETVQDVEKWFEEYRRENEP